MGAEIRVSLEAGQTGAPDDVMRALETSSGARHPMRRWMMESIGGSISGWHKQDNAMVNALRLTRVSSPKPAVTMDQSGEAAMPADTLPQAANTNAPDKPVSGDAKRAV